MEFKLENDMEFKDKMNNEEIREALLNFKLVLVNFRGYIEKYGKKATSGNRRSNENAKEINRFYLAMDKNLTGLRKQLNDLDKRIQELEKPFYKRILEKFKK